jgi:hypothetical protein
MAWHFPTVQWSIILPLQRFLHRIIFLHFCLHCLKVIDLSVSLGMICSLSLCTLLSIMADGFHPGSHLGFETTCLKAPTCTIFQISGVETWHLAPNYAFLWKICLSMSFQNTCFLLLAMPTRVTLGCGLQVIFNFQIVQHLKILPIFL